MIAESANQSVNTHVLSPALALGLRVDGSLQHSLDPGALQHKLNRFRRCCVLRFGLGLPHRRWSQNPAHALMMSLICFGVSTVRLLPEVLSPVSPSEKQSLRFSRMESPHNPQTERWANLRTSNKVQLLIALYLPNAALRTVSSVIPAPKSRVCQPGNLAARTLGWAGTEPGCTPMIDIDKVIPSMSEIVITC